MTINVLNITVLRQCFHFMANDVKNPPLSLPLINLDNESLDLKRVVQLSRYLEPKKYMYTLITYPYMAYTYSFHRS